MALENPQAIQAYYNGTLTDYRMLMHLKKHWGMHFAHYDDTHQTLSEAVLNTNEIMARMADVRPGAKVLDAGCGLGGSTRWLAKHKNAEVTGITIVAAQCKQAQAISRAEGLADKTDFYVRDMRDTKFTAGTFDVVLAIESVCHTQYKADFIKEAYRLLKPGGVLVVSDGFQKEGHMSAAEQAEMQRWLDGWAVPNLASLEGFVAALAAAGFEHIHTRDATKNVMPFSRYLYRWGRLGLPLSKLLEVCKLRSNIQTGNVVAAIWQYRTLKKGLWSHQLVKAVKPL